MGSLRDNPLLAGFCYTQLTDTLQETNGLTDAYRPSKQPVAVFSRHRDGGRRDDCGGDEGMGQASATRSGRHLRRKVRSCRFHSSLREMVTLCEASLISASPLPAMEAWVQGAAESPWITNVGTVIFVRSVRSLRTAEGAEAERPERAGR